MSIIIFLLLLVFFGWPVAVAFICGCWYGSD